MLSALESGFLPRKDEAPDNKSGWWVVGGGGGGSSLFSLHSKHFHLRLSSKGTFTYVITVNLHEDLRRSISSLPLQIRKSRFSKVK